MPVVLEQNVGPILAADGNNDGPVRQAKTGELVLSQVHGRYHEAASRNRIFFAANPTAVTTTVGLATTYVGIVLSNPVGSDTMFSILKVSATNIIVAAAFTGFGVAAGFNATTNVTHTTPLITYNSFFGGGTNLSVGKVDSSATLPTAPVYAGFLGGTPTATSWPGNLFGDLEGSLIIPPGGYVATVTTAASPASDFFGAIYWEEIPIV